MAFYSLSLGKLYKKQKTRKLNNLPTNFEADFYNNRLAMTVKITFWLLMSWVSTCRKTSICTLLMTG